jgi:acyl carrier protein
MPEKSTRIEIEQQLIAITSQLLVESEQPYQRNIQLDASLQHHLNIDSLMRAELFRRIGKQFNMQLPDEVVINAENLSEVANYIQAHLGQAVVNVDKERKDTFYPHEDERPHFNLTQIKTLLDIIFLYGERAPNKAHIYFQREDNKQDIITYGELLNKSLQVAYSLRQLGLHEGETVAIMLPTHPGFFYTFFGTLLAGGIPVPIYPPFRMHMLEAYAKTEAHILRNAGVRILVTFDQAELLSHLLKAFVPSLKHVKTVTELLHGETLKQSIHASPSTFAFIQYTSGSTSSPKGVLLTHENLVSNIRGYGKAINVTENDIAVSWLPLYHDMGLIGMWLGSLFYGAPLVLMTPFSFLQAPERWLWMIHYHRGTISGAPNFAYELCIKKCEPAVLEGLDLSSWRIAANGAEKIYPRTLEEFQTKFAPYGLRKNALLPVYGLAESTVALAIPPLGREFKIDYVDRKNFELERKAIAVAKSANALAFVACGVPMEGHAIRIVDEKGHVLPERQVGFLQFKGPSSMQGYYHNPSATNAVYHDGWIDSGDLAYLSANEVYITGRAKDLIIKAGRNIYPAEIEEIVTGVSGIRQGCVAAFGSTDVERATEKLVVVAETRVKGQVEQEKLIAEVQQAISKILDIVADEVVLVAPHVVPKTSSGKLQRSACKKMYEEKRLTQNHAAPWMQFVRLSFGGAWRKIWMWVNKLNKILFTVYVGIVFALSLIPVYLLVRFSSQTFAVQVMRFWTTFLRMACFCPLQVSGQENLTLAKAKPVIYAANHASYIDTIILLSLLPPETRFIGKKELLKAPVIGTFIKKLGHLVVDRTTHQGVEDTHFFAKVLQEGHPLLIFPEGTFGYASGLRPFRLGAFKIAVETQVAVCPIALKGTRQVLRDDEKLLRPGMISVTICPPQYPQGTEWQDVMQLRNNVRAEIAKHCGEPTLDFIVAEKVAPRVPHV